MIVTKKLNVYCKFVKSLATLSKCEDKQQAAIIINHAMDQVHSVGVNGGIKGGMECLCKLGTKYTCIHAEANAIAKCTNTDLNKIMICTTSPCVTCAALIANGGFSTVYYFKEYKDTTGLDLLKQANISYFQIFEGDLK